VISLVRHILRALPPAGRRLAGLLLFGAALSAQAHLMAAQQGTLNLVGDGAFMVLSVPVSALHGVDDNADGLLDAHELKAHWRDIEAQVAQGVGLRDEAGARPLQGLMLNLSPGDDASDSAATQLVVLGRFALGAPPGELHLRVGLFGRGAAEGGFQIKVTRGAQAEMLLLTPGHAQAAVLAAPAAVLQDYLRLGVMHIFGGPDHLLFLLVVLAGAWRWRQAVLALSCFTLGHAITLSLSLLAGCQLSPSLVEPAIALTIVGMAALDAWRRRQGRTDAPGWRLGLVFACALIHGMGMATVLADFGLDPGHRLLALAGFNTGVEFGQLLVAGAAWLVIGLARRVGSQQLQTAGMRLAGGFAMAAGSIWFFQRVI
jgi:hypothetical protein